MRQTEQIPNDPPQVGTNVLLLAAIPSSLYIKGTQSFTVQFHISTAELCEKTWCFSESQVSDHEVNPLDIPGTQYWMSNRKHS